MSVDVVSWVVISAETNSLTAIAYGPFTTMDQALQFMENRPAGFVSNVYELHTPLAAALGNNEDRAKVARLVQAFDHYMHPNLFDEQQTWLELKAAMYEAGWREDGA